VSGVARRGHGSRRLLALAASALLGLSAAACAQQSPQGPAASGGGPAAGGGQTAAATVPKRTVAVDPSGGPASLPGDVAAAIQAWNGAAPTLVNLAIDPAAASTIGYAPPALLGPDTYSLDLRTPGDRAINVELAPTAIKDHPMVMLHEIGVLLGLPEGKGDVMAYAVPATGEPDAPSSADIRTLQEQRTYAPEDLNHDGTVDFYDLVLFGEDFGTQGVNQPADFNHDGQVDGRDLDLLRKAYDFSPPSETAPGATPTPPANGAGSDGGAGGAASDNGASGQSGTASPPAAGGTSSPQDAAPGGGP